MMEFPFSKHRLSVLVWFLKRPALYKQFVREIFSFFSRTQHPSLLKSKDAEAWCKSLALDEESALKLFKKDFQFIEITEKYSIIIEDSQRLVNAKKFDWGGRGNISLNYNLANLINAQSIIETGVAYGWSSLSLLLSLREREVGMLTSIDMPFWGTENEQDIGMVVPQNLRDRWRMVRLADRDAIPKISKENEFFDLCHYDSDKSYGGKMWALPRLWDMIKADGILVCDDISDNLAFKDFSIKKGLAPIIVETYDTHVFKYVGLLKKPSFA